ncbi:MAG: hypothetical protein ABWY35_08070 [Pseudorhodoplanes sp.]
MSPELYFILTLAIKMAVTAGFVIAATVIAERAGPLIGALIVTLPISAGPAYVFVALDHDAQFVARAALASVLNNVPTILYTVGFVLLAQRFGATASVGAGLAIWLLSAFVLNQMSWPLIPAILLNVVAVAVLLPVVRRFQDVVIPRLPLGPSELVLRAVIVAILIAMVVTLSFSVGPELTGMIASFPATFTSTMIILQRRVGGKAAAAVMAHSLMGLLGFALCVAVLYLTVIPLGRTMGLLLALAFSMSWNFGLLMLRRTEPSL